MGVAVLVAAGALLVGCKDNGGEETDADAVDQDADAPDAREDTSVPDEITAPDENPVEIPADDVGTEDVATPDEAEEDVAVPDEMDAVEEDAIGDEDAADVPPDAEEDVSDATDAEEDAPDGGPSMDNWDLEDWSTTDPPPGFLKTTTADLASYTMVQSTMNHTPGGQYSAELTWTTTNTVEILAEYRYPVVSGSIYSCHAWILDNDPDGRARLVLAWYDASDVATREFPTVYTSDNPAWQELVYQSVAPVTAVSMTCGIRLYDVAGWDGNATVYFDDLSITQP